MDFKRRASRKNFLCATKILTKTCCTNSTISYNYQQVTSVDARFTCDSFDEEIESRRESKRKLPEAAVESVAVSKVVRTAVSLNGVSAGDHRNLFMEE